jgi:hypothetical protein
MSLFNARRERDMKALIISDLLFNSNSETGNDLITNVEAKYRNSLNYCVFLFNSDSEVLQIP